MSTMQRVGVCVICWVLLPAPMVVAQTAEAAAPGRVPPWHLSFVGGQAFIDRAGQADPAEAGVALLDGDRLRTEEGRLEVEFADGSLLQLERCTTVDAMTAGQIRLLRGRVFIVRGVPDPIEPSRYEVETGVASVQISGPGEFRVTSTAGDGGTEVELAVLLGSATIANDLGAEEVRAGEAAFVQEGLAPSRPEAFDSTRFDGADPSNAQRGDDASSAASADDLPAEPGADPGAFDQNDTSRDDQNDSQVVYLSVVSAVPGHGRGPGRPGAGAHGDSARRPAGVMAFSNRRSGTIERVDPREIPHSRGPWGAEARPAAPSSASRSASPRGDGSLSRAPSRGHSHPRSHGDAVDNSPRSAYGRINGGGADDSPGSASPRSYGLPSPSPMRQHADPRGASGIALSSPRRDAPAKDASPHAAPSGSSARPREPGRGIPSGGVAPNLAQPDSSSRPPAPRYNSGSGGSRPSAGGLSSAGPRGGRGRTPD